jgi:DMSO/TMAO reductase YedYZ molybdopterin-dependent catalytic subunit
VKRPGSGTGALVGLLLTAPLVATLFLGWRLIGLPFAPFDVFDWLTRVLPGGLITFGIDSMVKVIRALGVSETGSAAKAAEQAIAIGLALGAGTAAGALLFGLLRPSRRRTSSRAGLLVGAAAGLTVLWTTSHLGARATAAPAAGALWTVAAFLAWGASLAWAHRRLAGRSEAPLAARGEPAAVERVDRRRFIVRLGGAAATITAVGAGVGALAGAGTRRETAPGPPWSAGHPLPNSGADVEPAAGTRPELTPLENHYRIDINTRVPVIDEASWRLKLGGLVDRPVELTLSQIRDHEPLHQFVTLACISNPIGGNLIGTTRWTGVSLRRLLADVPLSPGATHLKVSAADGFYEVVSLETVRADERVMLAYAWDGLPLAAKHGFPLRIYIPDLYGMKQPKWIRSIEALDHWEAGYWVERGWDRTAQMKATAVIDTISVNMMLSQADRTTRIPVGGIAHAGARGISRVEVRVDDGPWSEARLRPPLSGTTWVVWRFDWPFQPGNHTFAVRCVDGRGVAQITEPAPPHPSGAAGIHSKSMML